MEPIESRQLLTYQAAQRLSGWGRRAFFERLKEHGIVGYVDPVDRRRKWLDRRDVLRIARAAERRETAA